MDCLQDFIGIAGCSRQGPLSGLYINDLPAIPLKSIAGMTDTDKITYLAVWDKVQQRALLRFKEDVYTSFKMKYKLRSLRDSYNLGTLVDTTQVLPAQSGQYRGFVVDVVWDTIYTNSQLQCFYVQRLGVYTVNPETNVVLNIYDAQRGLLMDSFTIAETVAGWNYVDVYKNYETYTIYIATEATFDTIYHEIPLDIRYNYTDGWLWDYYGLGSRVYAATATDPLVNVPQQFGINSYGITGIVSVTCSYDAVICNNKSMFKQALWYLHGVEMITEGIYNPRLSPFNTINRDQMVQLRKEYLDSYLTYLTNALEGIELECDTCLECDGPLVRRTALP